MIPTNARSDIIELRRLHYRDGPHRPEAYGQYDLAKTAVCEFLLDYEDVEDEDEDDVSSSPSPEEESPGRYRWPDNFRDEVLPPACWN